MGKFAKPPFWNCDDLSAAVFAPPITEQFGLPYLFGSGELSENSNTGPETNLGADCANFVVYALRRQGQRVPWSDPKRLRDHLDLIARSAATGHSKNKRGGFAAWHNRASGYACCGNNGGPAACRHSRSKRPCRTPASAAPRKSSRSVNSCKIAGKIASICFACRRKSQRRRLSLAAT